MFLGCGLHLLLGLDLAPLDLVPVPSLPLLDEVPRFLLHPRLVQPLPHLVFLLDVQLLHLPQTINAGHSASLASTKHFDWPILATPGNAPASCCETRPGPSPYRQSS
jgi:hypothetical protein